MSKSTQETRAKSSYIKNDREEKHMEILSIAFLVAYFILPQYLGVRLAGFDLTAQRLMMILILFYILTYRKRAAEFFSLISKSIYLIPSLIFLFVTFYTAGLRADINAFLQYFIEFICLFILIYIIKDCLGIGRTLKLLVIFIYILCVLGLVEYAMRSSPFHYLATLPGRYGVQVRSGSYRIMGPCNVTLAYGLVLLIALPIICIDYEEKTIDFLKNKFLMILLMVNVLLTGSRSTLALSFVEILIILIISGKQNFKKGFLYLFCIILFIAIFVVVFYSTPPAQMILRMLASLIDEICGTEYALKYGAETFRLEDSSEYREVLFKVFQLDWLSPVLGRGISRSFSARIDGTSIISIDNFYVALFIRFAYPGLITYIIFILSPVKKVMQNKNNKVFLAFLLTIVIYFVNLWWMDTLQTLKYVYLIYALLEVIMQENKTAVDGTVMIKQSKYIK